MIFVTVGHQMPFDRMLRLVDGWAGRRGRQDVFAQTGKTAFRPSNLSCRDFLSPTEFSLRLKECRAVVGHAGTGSIIETLLLGKPMLVLPRQARFRETRNDHQIGTARHFAQAGLLLMAEDDDDFVRQLDALESFMPRSGLSRTASPELIAAIRAFVTTGGR